MQHTFQIALLFLFLTNFNTLVAQDCNNGMAGDFPCSNLHLRSALDKATIGLDNGNDIWGWTSPTSGREYALVGGRAGTAFVDVTDANNAWIIGRLATPSSNSSWRDIKTIDNYAYIGSEANNSGIQVFDLTQLDAVTTPPNTPLIFEEEDNTNSDFISSSHNIVTNPKTGLLLAVGTDRCSGGLVMYDTKNNPADPPQQSCFSADGYTHDAVCFVYRGMDEEHIGKEICIGLNEDTYTIVDVTNRNQPALISRTGYSNHQYTHQGWITDDHRYLIVNDELDEIRDEINTRTLIFDLADLDNPIDHMTFNSTETAIDHNLYVRGSYVYQANYKAGLRILDISDLDNKNVTEVAYFDIVPNSNSAQFDGAWSAFPYFDSNKIIVNGINEGLFVVEHAADYFFVRETDKGVLNIQDGATGTYELEVVTVGNFSNDVSLTVTGLPPGATSDVAPVSTTNKTINTATLKISIDEGTPAGFHSLMVEATAPNATPQRLALGLIIGSPLATDLLSFQAAATKSLANRITWQAANETAQTNYLIQRSATGAGDWATIGEQAANGMTTTQKYEWLDRKPLLKNYYRLVTEDADGSRQFSPIELVTNESNGNAVTVYPNPVADQLQIRATVPLQVTNTLQIVNALGEVVLARQVKLDNSINYLEVNVGDLQSGVYFVQLDGEVVEKFVKK